MKVIRSSEPLNRFSITKSPVPDGSQSGTKPRKPDSSTEEDTKKGRPGSRPWKALSASCCRLVAHRIAFSLHHLHAHDVDGTLVRIDMGAQLHVVAFVSLHRLRVHDVPALAVFVVDEDSKSWDIMNPEA